MTVLPRRPAAMLLSICLAGAMFAVPPTAAAQDAASCLSSQLKLSSKACKSVAKCYGAALKAGTAVDGACVSTAQTKLGGQLAKKEHKGGCLVADAATGTAAALLASGGSDLSTLLMPGGAGCAAKKMQAAGKRCAAVLKCEAAGAAAGTNADSECLSLASEKFGSAFTKIDATGDCATTGDAAAVAAEADSLVDDVADYFAGRDCDVAADCPGTDGECSTRTCTAGHCGTSLTAAGTPVSGQTAGDCQKVVCNGSGGTTVVADDADGSSDDNACTQDGCSGGSVTHTPLPSGSECDPEGKYTCDGNGECLLCDPAIWCTDPLASCHHWLCHSYCYVDYDPAGTPLFDDMPGDCQARVCDGSGGETYVPDPDDGTCPP